MLLISQGTVVQIVGKFGFIILAPMNQTGFLLCSSGTVTGLLQ